MCDQVVALLSLEQSASLVWNEQESDTESVDTDVSDYDRLFAFEVAKTNEQEESAAARPGFQVLFTAVYVLQISSLINKKKLSQMGFPFISHHKTPPECPVDPSVLSPRLLRGETSQGILTASYIPRRIQSKVFDRQSFSETSLKQLLYVHSSSFDGKLIPPKDAKFLYPVGNSRRGQVENAEQDYYLRSLSRAV